MFFLVLILTVLVVALFSQVRGLRTRLEVLERQARQASPAPLDFQPPQLQPPQPQTAPSQAPQPVQNSPAAVPLNSTTASAPSPWPAGQAPKLGQGTRAEGWNIPVASGATPVGPVAASGFPGTSFPAPTPGNPANSGHGIRPPVQREPINVQRWLTRAGIVATLLGAAYVLAVLEAQGLIGPWWRVLAGLLLGGWLSWLAVRAASSVRAASEGKSPATSASPSGSLWVAEALGSLGIGVALLTLTFAARSGGGSGPWAAGLTLMAFAGALLARRWGGLATPLVALASLSVALLLAQNRPGDHLWNLSLPGLVCMVWTLAVLALLPLLIRERGWRVALPGAVALALLSVFAALTEVNELRAGFGKEQAGVALLVGALALLGVLLRPAPKVAPESAVAPEGLERTLRSLVGAVALGTATGAFCRLTGLDLGWAVPLAAALMVALLSALPSRLADAGVLRRVSFSAGLLAGVTAVGEGLALHSGDASGRPDWLLALACLGVTVLSAWRLDGGKLDDWKLAGGKLDGWRLYGLRVPRFLLVLALCVPLGLAFGASGVALPLVAWLARWQTGAKGATGIPSTSELPGTPRLSWRSIQTWHAEPPAVWAVVALPLLASGALAGPPPAHLGETFLLLLGAAALAGYSLEGLLRAPVGRLAWSGSWLLAALLGRVQGLGTENFLPTTPFLALLGGWLLFRAQPRWPGASRWKWSLWMSGAGLLVFALLRVLLSDLSEAGALVRAGGLLGAGLVTVLAAVRFPPPSRQEPGRQEGRQGKVESD
ncbi:hypothetical protein [Deinococcus sp. UYEF24]